MVQTDWQQHDKLQSFDFPFSDEVEGRVFKYESLEELMDWTERALEAGRGDTATINKKLKGRQTDPAKIFRWVTFYRSGVDETVEEATSKTREILEREAAHRTKLRLERGRTKLTRRQETVDRINQDIEPVCEAVTDALDTLNVHDLNEESLAQLLTAANKFASLGMRLRSLHTTLAAWSQTDQYKFLQNQAATNE